MNANAISIPSTECNATLACEPPSRTGERAYELGWLVVSAAMVCLCAGTVGFAVYREQPEFWRNSGGYAIWLRELVLLSFYPGMLVALIGQILLTRGLFTGWKGSARSWGLQMGMVMVGWLLLALSLLVAWSNNMSNLLDGRPIHTHL
ncbi:MAG: hypothetical protein JWL81_1725 [Verrucomicrobiales bacterium]|nr:hypothetical protein [Verrucomicrobiales bacterium]